MLLIFTHRRGFEADAVIDLLRERGQPFVRFNADDPNATFSFDPACPGHCWLECDGRKAALSELTAGWFQQDVPNPLLDERSTTRGRLAVLNRVAALDFLLASDSIRWMTRPCDARTASNKPLQLQHAVGVGLPVPATAVTNNLEAARSVTGAAGAIVKNLASPWWSSDSGVSLAYTREFDADVVSAEQVLFAPLIYQERLRRRRDIRVVVVGSNLFAAAMDSDEQPDARSVPLAEANYRPYDLNSHIATLVFSLCAALHLGYASIDLVEDFEGRIHFLEANTTGAFLWIERLCGYPIALTIADHLSSLGRA